MILAHPFETKLNQKGVEKDNFTPVTVRFVILYKGYVVTHVEMVFLMETK